MPFRDELLINKAMPPGQELLLAVLLSREQVVRLSEERLFRPAGISDQQFNVLRILKGGPAEGYSVFGQVVEGWEALDAIAATRTDGSDKPHEPQTIQDIEIGVFA